MFTFEYIPETSGTANEFYIGATTVAAVPVPAAIWFLASGLLGLVGFGRLRRRMTA